MKPSVRKLWKFFLYCFLAFNLLVALLWFGLIGGMPSISEIENPSSALSSEVLATDGTVIGRYFLQDRSNSKYKEISPNVFNALIATEDERFEEHAGVDGVALMRAIVFLGKKGGGSTITQQLAKNLFPRRNPNMFTMPFIKLKEWVLAVKLEKNLTKNEIITLYLNTVPFGDNVYGIKNAANTFFNVAPDKLSIDQAAVLIGMLKANTAYNPRRNPEKALARRNVVISQMEKYGKITAEVAEENKAKPIKLDYHKLDYHEGIAPYFRQVVELEVKKICKDLKKEDGSDYNIYKDGLKIYTTLNVTMQRYAEEAVAQHLKELQAQFVAQAKYRDGSIFKKHMNDVNRSLKATDRYAFLKEEGKEEEEIMRELEKPVKMKVYTWANAKHVKDTVMSPKDSVMYMKMFLQTGFMAMDPYTGEVRAWVGGINHDFFQFDHVNTNTRRQVGSTIKPLLYCLAIDNGFSPCSIIPTNPVSFPEKANYDANGGKNYGSMPMRRALALSINNAALYLIKQVGQNAFIDFAHKCGIEADIVNQPSIALGVSDISLYEMLRAYTMFPTGGINTKPVFISKIEDKNGNLIKSFVAEQKEIINANTAFKMVRLMRGVVDHGTAGRLRHRYNLQGEIAGKTGTTNSQADAWFIGYTPQILAGAWVGCDDRYLRFSSQALGQGAASALPIWAFFMKRCYADKTLNIKSDAKFEEPAGFDDCGGAYDQASLDRNGLNNESSGGNNEETVVDPMEETPAIPENEW
jgi:penicillin-binding protein 1A